MSIFQEKYSATRINAIHQLLVTNAESGTPKEFDVRVDDLKVVNRTSDPERFLAHEDFVSPESQTITICLYDGGSRRCVRYMLYLKADPVSAERDRQERTLAGIEQNMDEKLNHHRTRWDKEQLQKENARLEKELKEAEEEADDLHDKIAELHQELQQAKEKAGKSDMMSSMMGLAGTVLQSNPEVLGKLPIIGSLFGGNTAKSLNGAQPAATAKPSISEPAPERYAETRSDGTVIWRMKKPEDPTEALAKCLLLYFGDRTSEVLRVISLMSMFPDDIPVVGSLLEDKHREDIAKVVTDAQKQAEEPDGK